MKDFIKDVLIAIVIVAAISAVFKGTIVKESSMEPTLYENNYLVVNKQAYITKDHPEYEDIIVFRSDIDREDGNGKKLLIKRVIGVEGDVIDIKDGIVYRNGYPLEEPYTLEGYTSDNVEEYTVPQDQLFVMGDNRSISLDSGEFGSISEESIMGKAFIKLYPFNEFGLL